MTQYHKIQTIFKRETEGEGHNARHIIEWDWSVPEFELLKDIEWVWTEKIDGTNIRIMWDGEQVKIGGKTDNAQIPVFLYDVLLAKFNPEQFKKIFPELDKVCLYGEGYGKRIQQGGNYLKDRVDFILFDVKVGYRWLARENVEDIAQKFHIEIVPIVGHGTLHEAVAFTKRGFKSFVAENKEYDAEGLVMRPAVELLNRNGERVIAKLKHKDFIP